ncbi:hypothetical protein [Bradyrhizobium sp. STM 3566]|uniref:hypothetical protein n=1 Tax=Bradyrhizobium sp. STM 3566 TaxID=578928 RepID=UPI00389015E6
MIRELSIASISSFQKEVLTMAPHLALLSLILAFGVSVAFATVTTLRQVHLENASTTVHATRS